MLKRLVFFVLFVMLLLAGGVWFISANSRIEKIAELEGITEKYYWMGKLTAERKYRNMKLNGPTHTFYSDGTVKGEFTFKDGEMEGISRQFYRDGKLRYEDTYEGGDKVLRKVYDRSGNVVREEKY